MTFKAWVGLSYGRVEFFTSPYYSGVLHADLFRTRKAASQCYEDVRAVTVTIKAPTPKKAKRR